MEGFDTANVNIFNSSLLRSLLMSLISDITVSSFTNMRSLEAEEKEGPFIFFKISSCMNASRDDCEDVLEQCVGARGGEGAVVVAAVWAGEGAG